MTTTMMMTPTISIEARAKVNLTLEVFGTRPDGYHALRSVVMPITLSDTLTVRESDALTCDTGFADDLCLKAARALDSARGAEIRVAKRLPVGGGLGGGSADAAAALIALNRLWGLGRSRDELVRIAARVGSDVPSLTAGGAVVMEGRGEGVTTLEAAGMPALPLLIVHPNVFVSTAEIFARYVPPAATRPSATDAMVRALAAGDLRAVAAGLMNDLQATAEALHPEIAAACAALRETGAAGVSMSGSGSCVFGIFRTVEDSVRAGAAVADGHRDWGAYPCVGLPQAAEWPPDSVPVRCPASC